MVDKNIYGKPVVSFRNLFSVTFFGKTIPAFFAFIALLATTEKSFAQITALRRVNWTLAGLQKPTPVYSRMIDITTTGGVGNGTTPNDAALQLAITNLGTDSGVIYFPAGTYFFILPVTLRSGLVLRGQDASSTTLLFNLSGNNDLITISGNLTNQISGLNLPAGKNDDFVIVQNSSLFNQGDYVKLVQNDSALVFDIYHCVGQILRIKNIAADTVFFYSPLRKSYSVSDNPRLQKIVVVSGSGLECLKIKRMDYTVAQQSNIAFDFAAQCWVKGVESDSTNFAHISLSNSTNVEVTGCNFHGAFGYGPGGQGYGVACNRTTGECLIENNIFVHLRHSMLVQSGSNGNVFSYNYSRETYKSESAPNDLAGDIVLHGNYPYANLFEGNIVQNIVSDASHFINGPYNTFFRNRVELYGILYSTGSGDSSNIAGNEITSGLLNQGNYLIKGVGNFEYGNNLKGNIFPTGTDTVSDRSYYYLSEPYFWLFAYSWPSIGWPNPFNTRTIPAKARYVSGTTLTICPPGNIFPLHTISLTVTREKNKNKLTWITDNHRETVHFDIERSANGLLFTTLKEMVSTVGAMNFYTDDSPMRDINYYRILVHLPTGNVLYSNTVKLNNRPAIIVTISPNPVKDVLNIVIENGLENITAIVKNVTGQVLNAGLSKSSLNSFRLNVTDLSKGIYFAHFMDKKSGLSSVYPFVKD